MSVAARTCGECGDNVINVGAHLERCRGPRPIRLRQPTYEPWDWVGSMLDEDTDRGRVAPYLTDRDPGDEHLPGFRRSQ